MKKGYLNYISGFKGSLALLVVLHHFALLFFPVLINGAGYTSYLPNKLEEKIIASPFNIFGYGGSLAVSLFFIISAFLISYQYFTNNYDFKQTKEKIINRYFNLLFPILISSFLGFFMGWLFLKMDLFNISIYTSSSYYSNLNYDFLKMLYEVFIKTFSSASSTFNPPLWTMSCEFFGSCLIYIILFLFGNHKKKPIIYLLLFFLFINTPIVYFIIGLILADMFYHKNYLFKHKTSPIMKIFLFLVCIFLCGYTYLNSNIFPYIDLNNIFCLDIGIDAVTFIRYVSSTILFFLLLSSNLLQKLFSTKLFSFLSKYSVEIYIFHWPILYTVVLLIVNLFIKLFNNYIYATLFGLFIFLILIIVFSILYVKYISGYVNKLKNLLIKKFNDA